MSIDPLFSTPADIDHNVVRRLFSHPKHLNECHFLLREVSLRLYEKLDLLRLVPKHILDAGCGSGVDTKQLQLRYPDAKLIGLDGAFPILQQLQKQSVLAKFIRWIKRERTPLWICADFTQLPFPEHSFDLICANLALHWHHDPEEIFSQWQYSLRPEGAVLFSCFGPDTLREVRLAFSELDEMPHVLPFVDMHDYGDMLGKARFSAPVMEMERITLTYTSAQKLLHDVRSLGGNPLKTRRKSLFSRSAWKKVTNALEDQRMPDGRIPLSFELIFGHAFCAPKNATNKGEQIIYFQKHIK